MSKSTRTLTHYALLIVETSKSNTEPISILRDCLNYIISLNKKERLYDDDGISRFHVLDDYAISDRIAVGYFKSAKYNHRPPLIEKSALVERENPKKQNEGETEKTHFAIVFMEDSEEAILLLESKHGGVGIRIFQNYIDKFLSKNFGKRRMLAGLSVKGSFEQKLKGLERATRVEVYTPVKLVSDTFGVVSKIDTKEDVAITIRAKRQGSISSMVNSLYGIFSEDSDDKIKRIRVFGKDSGTDVLLDTDHLKDKNTVRVNIDANGQVETKSIMAELKKLAAEFL